MNKILYIFTCFFLVVSCKEKESFFLEGSIDELSSNFVERNTQLKLFGIDIPKDIKVYLNEDLLDIISLSKNNLKIKIPANASSGVLKILLGNHNKEIFQHYLKVKDFNWQKYDLPESFNYVEFVNDKIGFGVIINSNVFNKSFIYKTIDGGKLWDVLIDESDVFLDFKVVNENLIYSRMSDKYKISIDGGKNWLAVSVPKIEYLTSDFICFNSKDMLMLANKRGKGYVLQSSDGGNSWKEGFELANIRGGYRDVKYIKEVYFNKDTVCLYDAKFKSLLRSFDKGANWEEVKLDLKKTSLLTFDFFNETNFLFYDFLEKELFMFGEGGVKKNKIQLPVLSNENEKIEKIKILNRNKIVVLTNQGGLGYTNNRGLDWGVFYLENNFITMIGSLQRSIYMLKGNKLFRK
ncbi:WD40/YVTN/BNR-like repeat-containing protein [Tenacibaculum halocynthiae]|uniref:WD40/YVTN/BNR-like repeat-containing protein n=1 Tax=Tenacibaculum halocynthiae TaxID=1254437 RepID=UPI003D65E302